MNLGSWMSVSVFSCRFYLAFRCDLSFSRYGNTWTLEGAVEVFPFPPHQKSKIRCRSVCCMWAWANLDIDSTLLALQWQLPAILYFLLITDIQTPLCGDVLIYFLASFSSPEIKWGSHPHVPGPLQPSDHTQLPSSGSHCHPVWQRLPMDPQIHLRRLLPACRSRPRVRGSGSDGVKPSPSVWVTEFLL